MIKQSIFIYLFLCGLNVNLFADNINVAWRKIIFVESSNGKNPKAYTPNKCGALGIAQIRPIMVRDCNRILRLPVFVHSDALDDDASYAMYCVQIRHYIPDASVETICRFWYRGPNKRRQYDKYGDVYWQRCKKVK